MFRHRHRLWFSPLPVPASGHGVRLMAHEVAGSRLRLEAPRQPGPRLEARPEGTRPAFPWPGGSDPAGCAPGRARVPAGAGAAPARGETAAPGPRARLPGGPPRSRRHRPRPCQPGQDRQYGAIPVGRRLRVEAPPSAGHGALQVYRALLPRPTRATPDRAVQGVVVGRDTGQAVRFQVAEPALPVATRPRPPQVQAGAVRSQDHDHRLPVTADRQPGLVHRQLRRQAGAAHVPLRHPRSVPQRAQTAGGPGRGWDEVHDEEPSWVGQQDHGRSPRRVCVMGCINEIETVPSLWSHVQ